MRQIARADEVQRISLRVVITGVCLLSGCGVRTATPTYTPIYAVLVGLTSGSQDAVVVESQRYFHQTTGFLLNSTGLVATNYHSLAGYASVRVFLPNKDRMFDAELQLKDMDNDIAIVVLKEFRYDELFSGEVPYGVRSSSLVRLGEEVFTLGFPLGRVLGRSLKFSSGAVSSLDGLLDNTRLFQISNPVPPGSSGGPLFDEDGNLIGMALASPEATYFYENVAVIPENANFAVKSDCLRDLISTLPESKEILGREASLEGKPTQEQVGALVPYIVTVYVK